MALINNNLPNTIHLTSTLAKSNMKETFYYLKLKLTILRTQYKMLKYLNWLSPKNAISFRSLHHGLSFNKKQLITSTTPLAISNTAFYKTLKKIEYKINKTFNKSFHKSIKSDTHSGKEYSLFYTSN